MKKVLPFSFPIITSYPAVTYVLSVIEHDIENTAPWLCNHYIQLVSFLGKEEERQFYGSFSEELTFYHTPIQYSCPYIYVEVVNRYTNNITDSIVINYIKNMIDNGYYVEIFVDHFYLSVSNAYQQYHKQHPIFIYGYDDYTFYAADFFRGPFSSEKINFHEFLDAYSKDDETHAPFIHQCFRMSKYHPYDYKLDLELIKTSTKDYLDGCDSFKRYLHFYEFRYMKLYFGLNYYNALTEHLYSNNQTLDPRMFHVLYDHKVIMKFRIDYLYKNDMISNSNYQELIEAVDYVGEKANILRNQVLKYNISKQETMIPKIENNLNKLASDDKDFMRKFLDSI